MQQAIAVFTDATARDAAISVPVNGQFAYLTGSSSLTKYTGAAWVAATADLPITTEGDLIVGDNTGQAERLALGADGTVLKSDGTTAVWSTPSATDKTWEVLASGTISGVSELTISGFAAKNEFMLICTQLSSTAASAFFEVKFNGLTSGYINSRIENLIASSYSPNNYSHSTYGGSIVLGQMSASASSDLFGSVQMSGGKSGSRKVYSFTAGGNAAGSNGQSQNFGNGVHASTALITSFAIKVSSGTFDSGNYYLYGAN
tara:strand:- start:562 stop:1341 length:780 start_codon:yes stop_codon:yes gene_type:complete